MKDTLLIKTLKEHPERIPTMLEYKLVDVNQENHDGWVPLMVAIVYQPSCVQALISAGASLEPVKEVLEFAKTKHSRIAKVIEEKLSAFLLTQGVAL